jgi:hypothetical protein
LYFDGIMSEMQYFVDLENDLMALSPEIEPVDFSWNEYGCAIEVLQQTRKALREDIAPYFQQPETPASTQLGKRILQLRESGLKVLESTKEGPDCCEEAEWKLAHSLSADKIEDAKRRSPILLTIHGRAVAFGKQWGEPTWYGLTDVPTRGIYAGAFSAIAGIPLALNMPPNDRAYSFELPSVAEPRVIRFSLFATPPAKRKKLRFMEHEASIIGETTHKKIVNRCDELLANAQQISDATNE